MTPGFKRCLVVALLVVSLGTPWALLQSVAWVSMFADYSRTASLSQALAMTFDGKHPCKLCRLVQKGQAAEQKQQKNAVQKDLKLELAVPPAGFALFAPTLPPLVCQPVHNPGLRKYPPLVPPPRSS